MREMWPAWLGLVCVAWLGVTTLAQTRVPNPMPTDGPVCTTCPPGPTGPPGPPGPPGPSGPPGPPGPPGLPPELPPLVPCLIGHIDFAAPARLMGSTRSSWYHTGCADLLYYSPQDGSIYLASFTGDGTMEVRRRTPPQAGPHGAWDTFAVIADDGSALMAAERWNGGAPINCLLLTDWPSMPVVFRLGIEVRR